MYRKNFNGSRELSWMIIVKVGIIINVITRYKQFITNLMCNIGVVFCRFEQHITFIQHTVNSQSLIMIILMFIFQILMNVRWTMGTVTKFVWTKMEPMNASVFQDLNSTNLSEHAPVSLHIHNYRHICYYYIVSDSLPLLLL